jgi:tagatose-1,6-bisphosphate aldolase non-catalytic subunit AgaZ/GatZ
MINFFIFCQNAEGAWKNYYRGSWEEQAMERQLLP